MVLRIAASIWFLIYFINCFIPFSAAPMILGIDALVVAIAWIAGA